MEKGSKLFISLLVGAFLTIGTACSVVKETDLESRRGEEVAENLNKNATSPPETAFYVTHSGEEIPIDYIMGSHTVRNSFREMVETSDAIIIGESLESIEESEVRLSRSVSDGSFGSAASVTEFKVAMTLKGDFQAGDIAQIGQSAAILRGTDFGPRGIGDELRLILFVPENYRPLKKGANYILFLRQGLAYGSDLYFPAAHTAGRVNIDGTDELTIEMPVQQRIREHAIKLYQAAMKAPNKNPLAQIVQQSDRDFGQTPVTIGAVERDPTFRDIPDVEVKPIRETVEILPPAIERLKAR